MRTPPAIAASDGERRVDVMLHRQQREDHADERDGRADRQIEIAGDDQHHRADRGQTDDRCLQREQDEIALREKRAVGREVEEQPDAAKDEEQHRIAESRDSRQPEQEQRSGEAIPTSVLPGLLILRSLFSHRPPSAAGSLR